MKPSPAASRPAHEDAGIEYLRAMRGSFERAAASAGTLERDLDLAGLRLRLRFAGAAMAGVLLLPFQHLTIDDDGAPDLRVDVFDTASTGVEPPPLPWPLPEAKPGTQPVLRHESELACVLASAGPGGTTAADAAAGEAIFHLADASAVPAKERAGPLREAFHILTAPRSRWMTHAGAVGRDGRGVLLVGRSGSGKSTLALSCALAGMELAADDYVLLELGARPKAHALQSTANLTADTATRLGIDPAAIGPLGFEPALEGPAKAMVEIEAIAPGRIRRRLSIGAVVAPVVAGIERPELEPISAARGLQALAPSTVIQMRSRNSTMLPALTRLVREVPSYSLRLSPEPAANAAAVAEAVDRLD